MKVLRPYVIVNDELLEDDSLPKSFWIKSGDIWVVLSSLNPSSDPASNHFVFYVRIGVGPKSETIPLLVDPFLSVSDYARSSREPLPFSSMDLSLAALSPPRRHLPDGCGCTVTPYM